jgi:hypothetical protein
MTLNFFAESNTTLKLLTINCRFQVSAHIYKYKHKTLFSATKRVRIVPVVITVSMGGPEAAVPAQPAVEK